MITTIVKRKTAITPVERAHRHRKGTAAGLCSAFLLLASCGFPIVPLDYLIEEQDAVSHMTLVKEVRITDIGGLSKPWQQGIEAGNWPLMFPDPKSPTTNAFLILFYGENDYDKVRDLSRFGQAGMYIASLAMDGAATSITYHGKAFNDPNLELFFMRTPAYDTRSEYLRFFSVSSAGSNALGIVGPMSNYTNQESISLRVVVPSDRALSPTWNEEDASQNNLTLILESGINKVVSDNAASLTALTPTVYGAYPVGPVVAGDGSVRYGDLALAVQTSANDLYSLYLSVDPASATLTTPVTVVAGTPQLVGTILTGNIAYGFFAADRVNDRWFASRYFPDTLQYSRLSWFGNASTNTVLGSWPIVRTFGDGTVMRLEENSWAPLSFDSQGFPEETANARYKTGGLTFLYEYIKDGESYLMFDQTFSVPTIGYNALVLRAWTIKRSDFLALPR